jgi:hypothetical protein
MTQTELLQEIQNHAGNPERVYELTKAALAQPAPVQELIGYLFQHDETGLTTVVDVQQVEWGFEKSNPRYQKIGPVYTTPQQRPWVGLTNEEAEDIWEDHQFNDRPSEVSFANRMNLIQAIEAKLKELNQ